MSEELTAVRKNSKKALGRGLGSLLGEIASAQEENSAPEVKLSQPVAVKAAATPANTAAKQTPTTIQQTAANNGAASVSAPAVPETARIWTVAIEKLVANKEQPRKTFDPVKLQELANSIKEKGIILPIAVRKIANGQFEIIAGERRWRASQLAGLKEVPIIIKHTSNHETLELALIENIQRQDLNPLEEAEAYLLLTTRYGLTQQQVADRVGKERATVANLLRLVGLTAEVKNFVRTGELQLGQAKVLLSVEDPIQQVKLAKKVIQLRLSVRGTEKLVAKAKAGEDSALEIDEKAIAARDMRPLMSELQKIFGTKVEVDAFGEKSKITFHFYSVPELNQFIDKLRKIQK